MSELGSVGAVILDSMFDGVITTDADALITHVNPAAIQLMEWETQNLRGKPLSSVFPVDLQAAFAGTRITTFTTGRKRQIGIEYRITRLCDSEQKFAGLAIVFRTAAPLQPAYAAMRVLDGGAPPSTEELFEERERSRVTLDAIGDLVLSVNFRGHVNYLNKNAEAITGWTLLEAHGHPLEEVLPLLNATTRKPVESPAVRAIIENQKVAIPENCVLIGRNGAETAIEASASPIHDSLGGVIGAVIVAHDVTAARDLSAKLTRLALFDDLTGLPRRALLADRLQRALARAERNQCVAAVIFLDLDDFKPVNDSLGHSIGDALLQAVAHRLIGCVRGSDTVSRHGGDEFIILLSDVRHADEVSCCVDKVRSAFDSPFSIGDHSLQVSASIGAAVFPEMGRNAEELIQCADAAMYENKKIAKAAATQART